MREILFRGKCVDGGEWAYGDLYHRNDEVLINNYQQGFNLAVNPETVGQFTGWTDATGKKIFEGDIIRFHKYRYEPDWVGVVKYEHCLYMASGKMPIAYEKLIGEDAYYCPFEVQLSGIDKDRLVVIGNINDDYELLEAHN